MSSMFDKAKEKAGQFADDAKNRFGQQDQQGEQSQEGEPEQQGEQAPEGEQGQEGQIGDPRDRATDLAQDAKNRFQQG